MMKKLLCVPAPAKLNLFLHIVGQRSDGYHLLQSVFTFVDLCDYLDFYLRNDGCIQLEGVEIDGLAAEHNLIVRAAKLLQQHTGCTFGATIRCEKHIPAGAGLGGGSSDAATTLIALNRLWQTGLSRQELMQLGLQLGADVPVFIFGRSAFAEGVGEQLHAVPVPQYSYVLLKPAVSVATATMFADKNLTRNKTPVTITDFTTYKDKELNADAVTASRNNGSVNLFGVNVFEPVASRHAVEIQQLLHMLHSSNLHAKMTGSGSCVFVAFNTMENATRQHSQLCSTILHKQPMLYQTLSTWVVAGLTVHPLHHWLNE